MAGAAAALSAGFRAKAGIFPVQMLVTSLPLRREFARPFSSSLKPTASSYSRAVVRNNHRRWPRIAPLCTVAPDAGAAVAVEESESKGEAKEEEEEKDVKEIANLLEIRVGKVVKAWRHEEADSLYVEEVDVGEAEPRIICSGLVKYVPLDLLQDAAVVVLANLKPRNMRGVKSFGMLLAASDAAHENVELLVPPEGSSPGDRIWFGIEDDLRQLPEPAKPNQVQKKKIWELVQPHLKTDVSGIAMLKEHLMRTSAGVVTSKSLKNANIS
ncbi:PREDICTED: tyrosine--tRNA ligase, cytoplasmic-like [Tarenaya hassleriana]|uniref:tyrosine--tRNA ligase, cytoplasmic-like n=1 Tax=Tarenaya hassleriana TaxID=28532 RepID=UPI00053C2EA6|nr:PREDICTED: tyrosine--tRNA ligase, cytoplasmic-like [Tarenaya hassleriana]